MRRRPRRPGGRARDFVTALNTPRAPPSSCVIDLKVSDNIVPARDTSKLSGAAWAIPNVSPRQPRRASAPLPRASVIPGPAAFARAGGVCEWMVLSHARRPPFFKVPHNGVLHAGPYFVRGEKIQVLPVRNPLRDAAARAAGHLYLYILLYLPYPLSPARSNSILLDIDA